MLFKVRRHFLKNVVRQCPCYLGQRQTNRGAINCKSQIIRKPVETDSSSSSDSVFLRVASVDDYGGGVAMRIILVMWVVRAMATLVMIAFSVFTER